MNLVRIRRGPAPVGMAQPLAMRLHLLGGGVERVVELVDGAAGRNLWLSEARFKCLVLRSVKDPEGNGNPLPEFDQLVSS